MTTVHTTAHDLNKLRDDFVAALRDLGKMSRESESCRLHLLVERLIGIVECQDERTMKMEVQIKKLTGDGK